MLHLCILFIFNRLSSNDIVSKIAKHYLELYFSCLNCFHAFNHSSRLLPSNLLIKKVENRKTNRSELNYLKEKVMFRVVLVFVH